MELEHLCEEDEVRMKSRGSVRYYCGVNKHILANR
jgi:hypothetical protein